VFFCSFMVLFTASGAANGSCYRMIPVLFEDRAVARATHEGASISGAVVRGRREAAAVIGLTSAVGALGGFMIPRGMATSIGHTGSIATAMWVLVGFYGVCIAITVSRYLRPRTVKVDELSLLTRV
jgi:MFS transporter, NNP family, nitrate/nitrite transporter